jgi:hypothetical protein
MPKTGVKTVQYGSVVACVGLKSGQGHLLWLTVTGLTWGIVGAFSSTKVTDYPALPVGYGIRLYFCGKEQ